jgi:Mor family transcriptional regulator
MLDISGLTPEEIESALPKRFKEELGAAVSTEGLLALIQHFGGEDIYIPDRFNAGGKLAHVLSEQDFQRLVLLAGRSTLKVPLGTGLRRLKRNRDVFCLSKAGWSVRQIARQHEIRTRTVYRILHEMKARANCIS